MYYCGLCQEGIRDWDKHEAKPDHINKKKEFFANETKGIELIKNHMHLSSRLNAHIIYLILKGEYAK